jgi:hypothetical protein
MADSPDPYRVHQHFQRNPIITIPATVAQLSLAAPTEA